MKSLVFILIAIFLITNSFSFVVGYNRHFDSHCVIETYEDVVYIGVYAGCKTYRFLQTPIR